mgnify:CR=1 FL=1
MKPDLTIDLLCEEAKIFAEQESQHKEKSLYGKTDGKAVGTYLEHKFQAYLGEKYTYIEGSSASGIDFPELNVDMKVTRTTQPQSSCPYKSAGQKIYGLGYSLIVFVYEMIENTENQTITLNILHTIFIETEYTADYQTTTGILNILENNGNQDDIVAFLFERNLPVDDIGANHIAEKILNTPPKIGYLTISNALQWRLQYKRAIDLAGEVEGIRRIS